MTKTAKSSDTPMQTSRGKAKQELGIKYSIGKYGIEFGRPIAPGGKKYGWKFVRIIPLEGWLFGDEMGKEMRKRGFEL